MKIIEDDLSGSDVIRLLQEHLQDMQSTTPPESVHALDVSALRSPDITFWSAWQEEELLGCGALKTLDAVSCPGSGEIKSMRTVAAHLRKGVAASLLRHIVDTAVQRSYKNLFLETGSMDAFAAARRLYENHGFVECAPFADYVEDPNSVFYRLDI